MQTVDPVSGQAAPRWIAREPDAHAWTVYQGGVTEDERTLFISYHGPDTTGIDRFTVLTNGLARCPSSAVPGRGCIDGHGGFIIMGTHLLIATGGSAIIERDWEGQEQRRLITGLEHTHLMEFVTDPRAHRLYAVGSCGYTPGFSAVELGGENRDPTATEASPIMPVVVATPRNAAEQVCGERLALAGNMLVVGQSALSVPSPTRAGKLLLVDPSTGSPLQSIPLPAEPVDVAVVVTR